MTAARSLRRYRWRLLHQLSGLWLGAWFSVLGLSGTALVFYQELDELMNPELRVAGTTQKSLTYQQLIEHIQRAQPDRPGRWRIELPMTASRAVTARYYDPVETRHLGFAPLMLSVDPYSGTILRTDFWGRYAVTWIYDLHYTLLLGPTGKTLVAILGLVLLVSLLSGLWLWRPPPGKWRSAVMIKWDSSVGRVTYDLHRSAGVYGALVLLVLTLTGIAMGVPEVVNPLLDRLSPLQIEAEPASAHPAGDRLDIGLDRAAAVAAATFPKATLRWIETPGDVQGVYRFRLWQPGEPSRRFPKTLVWVDRYSGAVLAVSDPRAGGVGDTVLDWLHPLHSGEAFGQTGRVVVAVVGLLCPLLFFTGWLRFRQRTGRRQRREAADTAGQSG